MQARLAKPGKRLNYVVLPSKTIKYVKEKGDSYFLEPKKGLTLNDQAVTMEQQLQHGDAITLVEGFLGVKTITEWVFQSDPVKAKTDRITSEKANGKIPALPDTSTGSGDFGWSRADFTADQDMLYADDKEIPWPNLVKVLFWKTKKGYMSIGLLGAAAGAIYAGAAVAQEANGASEYDVAFMTGTWDIHFLANEKENCVFMQAVHAKDCAIIAKIIDFYSPVDLIEIFADAAI